MAADGGDVNLWDFFWRYGWTTILGYIGWQQKKEGKMHARISKVKDELHDHEIKVAEDYVKKDEMKDLRNYLQEEFRTLGDKIDGKRDK